MLLLNAREKRRDLLESDAVMSDNSQSYCLLFSGGISLSSRFLVADRAL